MLYTSRLIDNASVYRLVKLWQERYLPDFSVLAQQKSNLSIADLIEAASPTGRAKTVAKLKRLIELNCELAAIKTDVLFSYIPNVVNLSESQRLAKFVAQVYEKVVLIYQQQVPLVAKKFDAALNIFKLEEIATLGTLEVEHLITVIEPTLQEFQKQHLIVNSRTVGFMTTQFHFSTQLVLNKLTKEEQLLVSPYFKFIEEQVCMPWQRVCNAAAKHDLCSPTLTVVEQLLPQSYEIASAVYHRATRLYPNSSSLRGGLTNQGVMASTIRDLQMFQSYLWLCVLEGNLDSVEQALLPLCVMVFPSIGVTWQLVRQVLRLLFDELSTRLEPAQKSLVLPYAQAMEQLFAAQR